MHFSTRNAIGFLHEIIGLSLLRINFNMKDALSGLRQFLKMIKNAFYFTSKVFFVLKFKG